MKPPWLRYPPPLYVGIPMLVGIFCLSYILVNAFLLLDADQKNAEERELDIAKEQARLLASVAAASNGISKGFLQREIAFLRNDPEIHWAGICSEEGLITTSSLPQWIGQQLSSMGTPELNKVVAHAASTLFSQSWSDGKEHVIVAHPVPGEEEDPLRWVVIIDRDLSEPMAAERAKTIREALQSAGVHLLACFILWRVLHRYLPHRVKRLLDGARLLNRNPHKAVPLGGGDEFAEIYQALQESENRFRQITDNIRDVFYMITADFRQVLYLSPAFADIWGFSPDQPVNKPRYWMHTVYEDDRELVFATFSRLLKGARMAQSQFRIVRPDGELRWLETRAFPVFDEQGKISRIAGLTADISERKQLEQEVLDISENERRRIGHDLHDDLCQRLAAIRLRCEILTDKLQQKNLPEAVTAQDVSRHIGDAATLCRSLALGLSPVNLEGEGLMHALEKLVQTSKTFYNVPCKFECPEPLLMGNNATATHLYRITQELISNAARHAKPSSIRVRLTKENHHVRLEVDNDGAAFSKGEQEPHEGMGLRIIRYRASAIGAGVHFLRRSGANPGTTAFCLVPETVCNLV